MTSRRSVELEGPLLSSMRNSLSAVDDALRRMSFELDTADSFRRIGDLAAPSRAVRGRKGASKVSLLACRAGEGGSAEVALVSEAALSKSPDCISSVGLDSVASAKSA
eukprot:scaffold113660_cov75-Phaeocystis_antarctica.AAC.1